MIGDPVQPTCGCPETSIHSNFCYHFSQHPTETSLPFIIFFFFNPLAGSCDGRPYDSFTRNVAKGRRKPAPPPQEGAETDQKKVEKKNGPHRGYNLSYSLVYDMSFIISILVSFYRIRKNNMEHQNRDQEFSVKE